MAEDALLTGVSGEVRKRNNMPILLTVLLILDIAIFMTFQLQAQGHVWADEICRSAFGLCDEPFLLGAAVALIFRFHMQAAAPLPAMECPHEAASSLPAQWPNSRY